jgi:hypothetical protein
MPDTKKEICVDIDTPLGFWGFTGWPSSSRQNQHVVVNIPHPPQPAPYYPYPPAWQNQYPGYPPGVQPGIPPGAFPPDRQPQAMPQQIPPQPMPQPPLPAKPGSFWDIFGTRPAPQAETVPGPSMQPYPSVPNAPEPSAPPMPQSMPTDPIMDQISTNQAITSSELQRIELMVQEILQRLNQPRTA